MTRDPGNRRARVWLDGPAADERGSAAVEFALIASLLVFLLMLVSDVSLAITARMENGNAARAGAEYAAINGWNSSGIVAAATSATWLSPTVTPTQSCGCASASGIVAQTCGTTCAAGGNAGVYVTVKATASYTPVFASLWSGFLSNGGLGLTATTVTRIN